MTIKLKDLHSVLEFIDAGGKNTSISKILLSIDYFFNDYETIASKDIEENETNLVFTSNSFIFKRRNFIWNEMSIPVCISLHALERILHRSRYITSIEDLKRACLDIVYKSIFTNLIISGMGMMNVPIVIPTCDGLLLGLSDAYTATEYGREIKFQDGDVFRAPKPRHWREILGKKIDQNAPEIGINFRTFISIDEFSAEQQIIFERMRVFFDVLLSKYQSSAFEYLFSSDDVAISNTDYDDEAFNGIMYSLREEIASNFKHLPKDVVVKKVDPIFPDRDQEVAT